MSDVTLEIRGLDQLIKALGQKSPEVRVGILSDAKSRPPGQPSNAEIGAWHEFGTVNLPVRSFLRVPLEDNLDQRLESSGAFSDTTLAGVMAEGSVTPWLKKIAVLAEGIVLEAFDTGGFGKWKPSDMRYKKVHQTLVESAQLRNSVTSEILE